MHTRIDFETRLKIGVVHASKQPGGNSTIERPKTDKQLNRETPQAHLSGSAALYWCLRGALEVFERCLRKAVLVLRHF